MKFIDEANIKVTAGNGGSGFVGWRREKFMPLGGPDGGNGGNGGAVIFVADSGLNSLLDFGANPLINAQDGSAGGTNQKSGAEGKSIVRKIPVGTQIFFNNKKVADLSVHGARWVAARGGKGGKGNAFFKSSTNQAPSYAQPGTQGESFDFHLVLKSVADVGLIGLPNVGKSTLISRISAATPQIADYPFTTLQPHLGVVSLSNERQFVVADIPGLIPGAHKGKGLGIKFLKHIERTSILVQLIDATIASNSAIEQFNLLEKELSLFSKDLLLKYRIIVFSKADLKGVSEVYNAAKSEFEKLGFTCFLISSHTGDGLSELKEFLFIEVQKSKRIKDEKKKISSA
jgi:GTPase